MSLEMMEMWLQRRNEEPSGYAPGSLAGKQAEIDYWRKRAERAEGILVEQHGYVAAAVGGVIPPASPRQRSR